MFKKFLTEFKEFAEKGSAIDMAVGVIVGAAMGGVVNSLVKDVIMPPIGLLLGNVDFSQIFVVMKEGAGTPGPYASLAAASAAGATTLNIGLFVNSIVGFIITMFAIFLFVRVANKMRSSKVTTRSCPDCCMGNINVAATKCPYCCSALNPQKVEVKEAELSIKNLLPINKIASEFKKPKKKA